VKWDFKAPEPGGLAALSGDESGRSNIIVVNLTEDNTGAAVDSLPDEEAAAIESSAPGQPQTTADQKGGSPEQRLTRTTAKGILVSVID